MKQSEGKGSALQRSWNRNTKFAQSHPQVQHILSASVPSLLTPPSSIFLLFTGPTLIFHWHHKEAPELPRPDNKWWRPGLILLQFFFNFFTPMNSWILHFWSSFSDSDRGYLLSRKLHALLSRVFYGVWKLHTQTSHRPASFTFWTKS